MQPYGTNDPTKTVATYCADACRSLGACHAFMLDVAGNCTLLSRAGAGEGLNDYSNSSITVGCLKHALMWDILGGEVAVAEGTHPRGSHGLWAGDLFGATEVIICTHFPPHWLSGVLVHPYPGCPPCRCPSSVCRDPDCVPPPHAGATSSVSSGYRCLVDQGVTYSTISAIPINTCHISDCTAQCFLNQLCSVVVYDREACRWVLIWGRDGGARVSHWLHHRLTVSLELSPLNLNSVPWHVYAAASSPTSPSMGQTASSGHHPESQPACLQQRWSSFSLASWEVGRIKWLDQNYECQRLL